MCKSGSLSVPLVNILIKFYSTRETDYQIICFSSNNTVAFKNWLIFCRYSDIGIDYLSQQSRSFTEPENKLERSYEGLWVQAHAVITLVFISYFPDARPPIIKTFTAWLQVAILIKSTIEVFFN